MVAASIITVFAFLHVLSAIAWLGAAIFFVSVVGPAVRRFTPAASLEFLVKVGPRASRFFGGTATATIIFGLVLLYLAFGTDYTLWPTTIVVGFALGLIAYLDAVLVAIPSLRKADHIAKGLAMNPQASPPPPDFAKYLRRGTLGAASTAVILVLTTAFMVATGFPF
jgi:uncharacterized membrane protein